MAYSLIRTYAGQSLVDGFNWIDTKDPSNGFVSYKSKRDAEDLGLYSVDHNTGVVRLGVDSRNVYPLIGDGRPSVRIESKDSYNEGLFIADFLHMPASECGVWPAFWSYGPNWPMGGEIDIIEGAHRATQNLMSVHTSSSCHLDQKSLSTASGTAKNKFCDSSNDNIGCGYVPPSGDTTSYGDGFNAAKGGVYAMQWDAEHINIWHFERNAIPADIKAKTPHPNTWGRPQGRFGGAGCDVRQHFKDMSLVLNINFCGDFGNAAWPSSSCSKQAPTCEQWVAAHPEAFANAYWDIRYIDAYTMDTTSAPTISLAHKPLPDVTPEHSIAAATSLSSLEQKDAFHTQAAAAVSTQKITRFGAYSETGCYRSTSNWEGFHKAGEDVMMTIEACIAMCDGRKYMGVYNTACYCADDISSGNQAVEAEMCSKPCPGKMDEMCGGLESRQVLNMGQTLDKSSPFTSTGNSLESKTPFPKMDTTHTSTMHAMHTINSTRILTNATGRALTENKANLKPTGASSTTPAFHMTATPMLNVSRSKPSRNVLRRSLYQSLPWLNSTEIVSREAQAPGMLLSVYMRTQDVTASALVSSDRFLPLDVPTRVTSVPPVYSVVQSASPKSLQHQLTVPIVASDDDSCHGSLYTMAPVVLTIHMAHPDSGECGEQRLHSFVTTIPGTVITPPLYAPTQNPHAPKDTPIALKQPEAVIGKEQWPSVITSQSHLDASTTIPFANLRDESASSSSETLPRSAATPLAGGTLESASSSSETLPRSAATPLAGSTLDSTSATLDSTLATLDSTSAMISPTHITTASKSLDPSEVLPTSFSFTTTHVPIFNLSSIPLPPNITIPHVSMKGTGAASKSRRSNFIISLFVTFYFFLV